MTSTPEHYRLAPDVILVEADDGSARLLDMSGSFFALSRSGAELLGGLLTNGAEQTIKSLSDKYAVEAERIETDLRQLLDKLLSSGLIQAGGRRSLWARVRSGLARSIVPVLLRLPRLERSPLALLTVARLCFLAFGWADTVAAWGRNLDRSGLGIAPAADAGLLTRVDDAIRGAAARLPSVACKERALSAWYVLRRNGVPASLVVGVQLYPLGGHCWCEVGSRVLTDFADHCRSYLPVVRYGATA